MLHLNLLLALVAFFQLVRCNENYTFSKSSSSYCFPVFVPSSQDVTLDLSLTKYEPLPGLTLEENKTRISVIFYRRLDINGKKHFLGDYNVHIICDDEAMNKGYCEEKHKGKILFEYKDNEKSKGKAYNEVLTELDLFSDVFSIHETGYYCFRTIGVKAKDYKLNLILKDGHRLELSDRESLHLHVVKFVLSASFLFYFLQKWKIWSQDTSLEDIPYLVRVLLIDVGLLVLQDLLDGIQTLLGEDSKSKLIYNTVKFSGTALSDIHWVGKTFFLFQYSGNFTYDKFDFEHIKIFISALCIELIPLVFNAFFENIEKKQNFMAYIVMGIGLLIFIAYSIIYIRIIIRWRRTSKEFYDFQKSDDPKLPQFKWLIFGTFLLPFVLSICWYVINDAVINNLLWYVSFYKEHYLLDEYHDSWAFYRSDAIAELINLGVNLFVYYKFWTPDYFKKSLEFSKTIE